MKLRCVFLCVFTSVIFSAIGIFAADTNTVVTNPPVYAPDKSQTPGPLPNGILVRDGIAKKTNITAETAEARFLAAVGTIITNTNVGVTTPPVYVPDMSHASEPLPDEILTWDGTTKETNVSEEITEAHFVYSFTNVSTNPVVFLSVRPSCGCTTVKLPPLPWTIPAGSNAQFEVMMDLAGKSGTLPKTVNISTDKGFKILSFKVTILPFVMPVMSEADRLHDLAVARTNRQAVFQGECAVCHVKRGTGKYAKALYDADCAICHEGKNRAVMVPDLHAIKMPTNYEFWRTWIAHGKPGSLMPAFSTTDGGPLSDMQIASLVSYLDAAISPPQ